MASKEDREYIGRYIDIEGTRLSDDDAELLIDFIDNINSYNDIVKERRETGISSEGKFTRIIRDEYIVNGDYTITHINSDRDDDGQTGGYTEELTSAREIVDVLKEVF